MVIGTSNLPPLRRMPHIWRVQVRCATVCGFARLTSQATVAMGLELTTRATLVLTGGSAQSGEAKALLESDALILRGGVRARIPRSDIMDATVKAGVVTVIYAHGSVMLALGDDAQRFVTKLREPPKSLLDKMGIGAGQRAVVIGVQDASFAAELAARDVVVSSRARPGESIIVLGVSTVADLRKIQSTAMSLAANGSLWVVHPKGTDGVKDTDIFAKAKAAGLTYTKVVRFSDTHTAERLAIPKVARAK
jgi:hypothetical protein